MEQQREVKDAKRFGENTMIAISTGLVIVAILSIVICVQQEKIENLELPGQTAPGNLNTPPNAPQRREFHTDRIRPGSIG